MNKLPYVIQCQAGSSWRTVGSRREVADAESVAKAWADDSGIEHRILAPNGSVHLPQLKFAPSSDEQFRSIRYGIRRSRGESKVVAEIGADADLASRRDANLAAAGELKAAA